MFLSKFDEISTPISKMPRTVVLMLGVAMLANAQGSTTSAAEQVPPHKPGVSDVGVKIPLEKKDGEDYELTVPGAVAKGTVEYVFVATNSVGKSPNATKPFSLSFKKGGAAPAADGATASSDQASGGAFVFAHKPLVRSSPGAGISIRVQATPPTEAEAPTRAMLLTRDSGGNDQLV